MKRHRPSAGDAFTQTRTILFWLRRLPGSLPYIALGWRTPPGLFLTSLGKVNCHRPGLGVGAKIDRFLGGEGGGEGFRSKSRQNRTVSLAALRLGVRGCPSNWLIKDLYSAVSLSLKKCHCSLQFNWETVSSQTVGMHNLEALRRPIRNFFAALGWVDVQNAPKTMPSRREFKETPQPL